MTKIKIRSNPYNREISYLTMDEATGQWVDVRETDERSRLRETDSERSFLPFKIKEIITIIIKEYYVGREKVQLYFEGTQDEYYEVEAVCESDDVKDKIELIRTNTILENARFIKGDIKEVFERVNPVIENIMKEDFSVKRGLRSYNDRIKRIVNDMSQSMNEDCFSQFKIWEEKLLAKINANLTELNPELKSLAEIIRIETENITELENNQTMIQASLDTIKDLMSWKEAEEE